MSSSLGTPDTIKEHYCNAACDACTALMVGAVPVVQAVLVGVVGLPAFEPFRLMK
jgi:hypothetical protein